jgi:hypothetical protein
MAALRAAALLLVTMGVTAAAQQQTTEPQKAASPMTLSGCVAGGQSPQAPVTFADGDSGSRYRLTGRNLKKYAGQRVEIVGILGKPVKFAIKGGLYPSPNVAAQAGALDPARAAIAAQRGGPELGAGEELPELRVSRVKVLEGSCK